MTVSIAIPSRNERFLRQTILDVLAKAEGDVEVLPVLDGYDLPPDEVVRDERVRYLRLPQARHTQKRHRINLAVSEARGEYVMSVDAHCMFAPGFDRALVDAHQWNWVQIPRRHRLDAERWCLQTQVDQRPPIDYEYLIWSQLAGEHALHGFKWDARTLARRDIEIDDTIEFQGSCWFMARDWYHERGFMQVEGYTGWGQEAEEIGLETWLAGGRVVTNKRTWYAHLHKGPTYGRGYWVSRHDSRLSYAYSYQRWVVERARFFEELVSRFEPLPLWPADWRARLWPVAIPRR